MLFIFIVYLYRSMVAGEGVPQSCKCGEEAAWEAFPVKHGDEKEMMQRLMKGRWVECVFIVYVTQFGISVINSRYYDI